MPGGGNQGIGAAVRRLEDRRFLTGQGRFVDDWTAPGLCFASFARSPHAHARIVSIDKRAALEAPGVLLVLTGEDAAADRLGSVSSKGIPPDAKIQHQPQRPVLALSRVRHVGDPVAVVIAETSTQARDAAELLEVEYEPLPAVTLADAMSRGAPCVWDEAKDNVSFRIERGDPKLVDKKFSEAAHVTRISLHYPRASPNSIEPRAVLAHPDRLSGRFTVYTTSQTPFRAREDISATLGIPELSLRVVAPDVGGGFGMKSQAYTEELAVVWAARKLDRPVKWTADRSESIANDTHGRSQMTEAELALAGDGRITALRASVTIEIGAYHASSAGTPPNNSIVGLSSTYRVPCIHGVVNAVFTNTGMVTTYRGSGKPEANFVIERLVDKAAREMGIDGVEMRRRNLIPASAMPYETPMGHTYDTGEFEAILDKTLRLADWKGFPARRAESERRGVRRGIGLGLHCQRAGLQSERMELRVAPGGSVAVHVGTHSHGQSHETMFAQMVNEWLGVSLEQVQVFQGDTDTSLYGRGSYAQRSMIAGGSALKLAAEEVIRKGRRLSAWMLEAAESDIEFARGTFRVKGTDLELSFAEVARKAYQGTGLPPGMGLGLDGAGSHPGPNTFPNGGMVCEVEVDVDTGVVRVVSLAAVDDCGVVVNPLTLEGQLHGSTAQGLGEALFEQVVYDRESGQLVTGSFTDYAMPRADDMPPIVSEVHPVPAATNLLGVKGGSEAGNAGAPPAIVHAIIDALSPWGVTDIPMPATPDRIWRAIRESGMKP